MAISEAFEWLCQQIEEATPLDRLEARGTVRLAIKEAGLDARTVSFAEVGVLLKRVLPLELRRRGIDDGEPICASLFGRIGDRASRSPSHETPEAVFSRLGPTRR
jgi:hypothetical protein